LTEQLVAAALAGAADGGLNAPAVLPGRLAELLAARAGRCTGEAQTVLAGLAVAGRPLDEDLLGAVTGLAVHGVRGGLRELAAARLLAEDTTAGAHRPRHALLAEAVAGGLLPGERAALHEQTARALAATGDQTLAAEVAGHWAAARRPADELSARIAAGEVAERVFGYAEAAAHWQRAIELGQAHPDAATAAAIDLPRLYVQATDAFNLAGDGEQAAALAEEAYRRFAGHPDPATAAVIRHRAGFYQSFETRGGGLALIEEALPLYGRAPPSADHAMAQLDYASLCLWSDQDRLAAISPALSRALEIAEAAGATALLPRVLAGLALGAFLGGQIEEGTTFLRRARTLAQAAQDGLALARLAVTESDALFSLATFDSSADTALSGLRHAQRVGLGASWYAAVLAFNVSRALLVRGRTAEAGALIDPLTGEAPDRDHLAVHEARAEIDLLRGEIEAAEGRRRLIDAIPARLGNIIFAHVSAQRAAELAVWAGRPDDALDKVRRVLPLLETPDTVIVCGWMLAVGTRACADLAERARARRDEPAARAAGAAAGDLASWAGRVSAAPLAEHPFVATIPAERASWDAERTRLAGASDPEAWGRAASAWQDLGCPHRAGYAWWRQAQAQLDSGQPAPAAAAPGGRRGARRGGRRRGSRPAAGTGPRPGRAGPHPDRGPAGGPRRRAAG
jgi:hypothetical protein